MQRVQQVALEVVIREALVISSGESTAPVESFFVVHTHLHFSKHGLGAQARIPQHEPLGGLGRLGFIKIN